MNATLPPPIVTQSPHTAEDVIAVECLRRISVDEYRRMIAEGILKVGEPVELLDGFLVEKMARHTPHDSTLTLLLEALFRAIPSGWKIRCQCALDLGNSQPEPDLAVVRPDAAHYRTRHPSVADVAFLIEIADSSLEFDLNFKCRLYSRENVLEYWVIDATGARVEVFTQPTPAGYQSRLIYPVGTQVPVVLDGQQVAMIDVAELFR